MSNRRVKLIDLDPAAVKQEHSCAKSNESLSEVPFGAWYVAAAASQISGLAEARYERASRTHCSLQNLDAALGTHKVARTT